MNLFKKLKLIVMLFCIFNVSASQSSGKITMVFDLSDQINNDETQLWIPYPGSNKFQKITNIEVSGDFNSSAVYTDTVHQIPMLYAKWDPKSSKRTLKFSFEVVRMEVIHNNLPDNNVAWNPKDYSEFLSATTLGPIDGKVKELADKITKDKKSVLEKARAIYDWTCENTYRDPNTNGCGVGDVFELLKEPGGKCADISSIFVALCRAAGVPAKDVFGIRQGKEEVQDISKWQHCWAEFFLPGYGWVAVDPADVRKMMLKGKYEFDSPETKKLIEKYWNGVDPYRVKLSEGRDIHLNPKHSGKPVNYLMYPFAQVGDKTLDWLSPDKFKYTITYTKK